MARKSSTPPTDPLTPEQLASRWENQVSLGTLRNWRSLGRGPAFQKVRGGRVLYRRADVLAFEAEHRFRKSPNTKPT